MADDQPWKIPPNVQELAAAGAQEPPSRYVVRDQDRPAVSGSKMPEPIPVVDLSRLSSGAADEMAKLRSALQNWGLFLAVGHGIEPALLGDMMNVTREFYKLPLEEKQKYTNLVGAGGKEFRIEGYGSDMVLSETQILDWCDRFYLIVEPESHRLHTLWPTQPPSFRDVLHEYSVRCRVIADGILRDIAKLVGLREDYFSDMLDEKVVTYVRLNYYPRCPRPDRVLGFKPHSDGSMVTILLVDDRVTGLQVLRDGAWYDVPMVPDALLVNLGDTVEIVSNGLLKSPVHRVATNAERERVSVVMFYTLDPEREVLDN